MKSIKVASDLVTLQRHTIDGFIWQAREKRKRAESFLEVVNYFRSNVERVKKVEDIRGDDKLLEFVLAACMLSKKSLKHLAQSEQDSIISSVIDFERLSEHKYLRLLENQYCFSAGDSLGGSMRNIVGQQAQKKLSLSIFHSLKELGEDPETIVNKTGKIVEIKWSNHRCFFDKKPKFIGKNIDIIIVKGDSVKNRSLECPKDYVCCGELKGGIDPAGADEHWKTAKTALDRIKVKFEELSIETPKLTFLGASIQLTMADEIFSLLSNKYLSGAANINYSEQLREVIEIMIS